MKQDYYLTRDRNASQIKVWKAEVNNYGHKLAASSENASSSTYLQGFELETDQFLQESNKICATWGCNNQMSRSQKIQGEN